MKKLFALALTAFLLTAGIGAAHAAGLDVATAKAQGLIGEDTNGLLDYVTKVPSVELTALVEKTNKERLAIYQAKAQKERIGLNQIQLMAGEKIYALEKPGNYLKYTGQWQQK